MERKTGRADLRPADSIGRRDRRQGEMMEKTKRGGIPLYLWMLLGFAVGILVSLLKPEIAAREGHDAKERRMIMGTE